MKEIKTFKEFIKSLDLEQTLFISKYLRDKQKLIEGLKLRELF